MYPINSRVKNMRSMLRILLIAAVLVPAGESTLLAAKSTYDAIEEVRPKMVKIFGAGGLRRLYSYSTGFLVSPEGHIATVWSHVLDTDDVSVVLDDGRKFRGKVLGAEPQLDLAVLKIDAPEPLPHFDLTQETATAGPGTRILAFSNMFKVATGDEPVSVLHGVIAARTKLSARRGAYEVPYDGPVYVVDAITNNPGAGGGMLTTRDGRLLGMIGKELKNAESNTWINYAIPLSELQTPIREIITGKFESRPTNPLDEDGEDHPGRYAAIDFGVVPVPDVLFRTPAYIDHVIAGSAAEKVGLQPDDLILFVNDKLVPSSKDLEKALGKLEPGDLLRMVVRRGGALVSVEMPVERKEMR